MYNDQVLYAKRKLNSRELTLLQKALEDLDFVCGTVIQDYVDDVKSVLNKVGISKQSIVSWLSLSSGEVKYTLISDSYSNS